MAFWYSTSLGDAMLADQPLEELAQVFRATREQAGRPEPMAAFLRHESEGRLHCEVKIYFSPGSAEVARQLGAEPCAAPSRQGLTLLVGSIEAWALLFPNGDANTASAGYSLTGPNGA